MSLTIGKETPSVTLTDNPAGTSIYGVAVTLTATIHGVDTTPTGTVTFKNGAATLGTGTLNSSGVATITFTGATSLPVGTYTITAVYSGDTNFNTQTSSAITHTVTLAPATDLTTTITSSLNPSIYGDQVTYTISVTSSVGVQPTGTVTLSDNGTSIGTATLNSSGQTTITIPLFTADTHNLTLTYGGDSNYP